MTSTARPLPSAFHAATTAAANEHPGAATSAFGRDLLAGLLHRPRRISPKYFYDQAGSALFDQICELPEYYPTRTEHAILLRHTQDMADLIGPQADLIEFGAGSIRKTRILLDALQRPRRLVPIDISAEHLGHAARALRERYAPLEVHPLAADFTQPFSLPPALPPGEARARVGLFLGSSLGNYEPDEALRFLQMAAGLLQGGGLLIGIDLVKDPAVLHAAYNDAQGVTAAFNRNLLVRANRELAADFQPERFAHYACYQPHLQRVEMHLISLQRQVVRLCGQCLEFAEGDAIHTENSHKFSIEGFRELACQAGFRPGPVWLDARRWYAVQWLHAEPAGALH